MWLLLPVSEVFSAAHHCLPDFRQPCLLVAFLFYCEEKMKGQKQGALPFLSDKGSLGLSTCAQSWSSEQRSVRCQGPCSEDFGAKASREFIRTPKIS